MNWFELLFLTNDSDLLIDNNLVRSLKDKEFSKNMFDHRLKIWTLLKITWDKILPNLLKSLKLLLINLWIEMSWDFSIDRKLFERVWFYVVDGTFIDPRYLLKSWSLEKMWNDSKASYKESPMSYCSATPDDCKSLENVEMDVKKFVDFLWENVKSIDDLIKIFGWSDKLNEYWEIIIVSWLYLCSLRSWDLDKTIMSELRNIDWINKNLLSKMFFLLKIVDLKDELGEINFVWEDWKMVIWANWESRYVDGKYVNSK